MALPLELLVCVMSVCMVLLCPYTKVEESFNLQAIHDILYHSTNIDKYDHHEFPGVVPRTFSGPITVAAPAYPLVKMSQTMGATKFTSQYIVRIILSLIIMGTLISYNRAVAKKLGTSVSQYLCLVTLTQFHFLFYSSRPLPNTFALALVLLVFRFWILQNYELFIWTSGAAIILFRFELVILFGLILMMELVSGRLKIIRFLFHVIPAGMLWLSLTVVVDSLFWNRWVWPEGEVFWYNTILNKSSEWGTSPIWWYFTSALPRSLLLPLFMIPWGVYRDRRTVTFLIPAIGFVIMYSLLPHKELRFIIYTIPLFNTIAAAGYSQIWKNRYKYPLVIPAGAICSLLVTWGLSLVFLVISINNYPGGHAFHTLHKIMNENENHLDTYSVHIGVEAAMTGVSRFGEINPTWKYSKIEGLQHDSKELLEFDFLLISAGDYHYYNTSHYLIHKESGYSSLSFTLQQFPPVTIIIEDKIFVLKRKGCSFMSHDEG